MVKQSSGDSDSDSDFLLGCSLFDDETDEYPSEVPTDVPSPTPKAPLEFRFGDTCVSLPLAMHDSISSALWFSSLMGCACLGGDIPECSSLQVEGLNVLELGCGRGLLGMAAKAFGAKHVTFTDCDDRALNALGEHLVTSTAKAARLGVDTMKGHDVDQNIWWRVCHVLWEDELIDSDCEERDPTDHPPHLGRPHWSSVHRAVGNGFAQQLAPDEKFDVVLAADCLYFAAQEKPFVDVLRRRLRREPNSFALIVAVQRANGGFQVEGFKKLLGDSNFSIIHHQPGEVDTTAMLDKYMVQHDGQNFEHSRTEMGFHIMEARWSLD